MSLPRWSSLTLRTKGLVVVALPVLPLLFFWLIIGAALVRQAAPASTATRTLTIQAGLARAVAALLDTEAAARAYAAGGGPDALARFDQARGQVPAFFAQVDQAVIDDGVRASLRGAETRAAAGLDRLSAAIAQAPASPGELAAALDASAATAEDVRARVASIEQRVLALQAERAARSQRATLWLLGILLGGSLLCTGAGFAGALVLARGINTRAQRLTDVADALANGEVLPVQAAPIRDEIDTLDAHLRRASALLEQRARDLRDASHTLDDFFNLSGDLFCVAGFDGYFKRLNPAWARTFGFTTEEFCARPFIEWVHPDDRERTISEAGGLARGQETVSFENRYLSADGSYRWLLWNARSRVDEGVIYASARDVSDEREARLALDRANTALRGRTAELEASNRELEAFSYSVSHDLRAPLRAIAGFSQSVEEDYADRLDDAGRHALGRIRAGAMRMGQLIDELIDLSRFTRADMQRQPVDLTALAAAIVAELRQRAPGRDAEIAIAEGLVAVGDPRMLRVALQNLLENAWKYTGRTAAARIELGVTRQDGADVFHVRDNGAGFDNRYAAKLFSAFERLHTESEFEGTGIGLATVQRIVRRHGGRIWADGRVGAGAVFFFTLEPDPRRPHDSEPDDSARRGQPGRRRPDLAGVS